MSHGVKDTAKSGKYQGIRRRLEILESRAERVRRLQNEADTHQGQKLAHARAERAIRAEITQIIKLGFEGV